MSRQRSLFSWRVWQTQKVRERLVCTNTEIRILLRKPEWLQKLNPCGGCAVKNSAFTQLSSDRFTWIRGFVRSRKLDNVMCTWDRTLQAVFKSWHSDDVQPMSSVWRSDRFPVARMRFYSGNRFHCTSAFSVHMLLTDENEIRKLLRFLRSRLPIWLDCSFSLLFFQLLLFYFWWAE